MNPRMNLKAISLVALAACLAAASVNAKFPSQTHKTEKADEPASAASSRTPSHPLRHADASTTAPTAVSQTSLASSSVTPGGPLTTTRGRSNSASSLDELLSMPPRAFSSAAAAAVPLSLLPGPQTRTGTTPPAIDPALLQDTPPHSPTQSRDASPVDPDLMAAFQAATALSAQSAALLGVTVSFPTAPQLGRRNSVSSPVEEDFEAPSSQPGATVGRPASVTSVSSRLAEDFDDADSQPGATAGRRASVASVSSQIAGDFEDAGSQPGATVGRPASVTSVSSLEPASPNQTAHHTVRARSNSSSSAGSTTESSNSGEASPAARMSPLRVDSPAEGGSSAAVRVVSPAAVDAEAEAAQVEIRELQGILEEARVAYSTSLNYFQELLQRTRNLDEEYNAAHQNLGRHRAIEARLREDLEEAKNELRSAQTQRHSFAASIEREREERLTALSNLERDWTVLQVQRANILESFSLLLVPDERGVSELDKVIREAQKFSAEASTEDEEEKRTVGYCLEDLSRLQEALTTQDGSKKERAEGALRAAEQVLRYIDQFVEEKSLPQRRANGNPRTITGLLTGMADTLRQMSPAYKLRELENSQRAWEEQSTHLQWVLNHARSRNAELKASIADRGAEVEDLENRVRAAAQERDLLESHLREIAQLSEVAASDVEEQKRVVQSYDSFRRQAEEELRNRQQ